MADDREIARRALDFQARAKNYRLMDIPGYMEWAERKLKEGAEPAFIAHMDATGMILLPEELSMVKPETFDEMLEELNSELGEDSLKKESSQVTTTPDQSTPLANARISRLAIASLIVSMLSFFAGVFGVVTGLIGAVMGHLAIRSIRRQPAVRGSGLATAGVALGYLCVVVAIFLYDWGHLFRHKPQQEIRIIGP